MSPRAGAALMMGTCRAELCARVPGCLVGRVGDGIPAQQCVLGPYTGMEFGPLLPACAVIHLSPRWGERCPEQAKRLSSSGDDAGTEATDLPAEPEQDTGHQVPPRGLQTPGAQRLHGCSVGAGRPPAPATVAPLSPLGAISAMTSCVPSVASQPRHRPCRSNHLQAHPATPPRLFSRERAAEDEEYRPALWLARPPAPGRRRRRRSARIPSWRSGRLAVGSGGVEAGAAAAPPRTVSAAAGPLRRSPGRGALPGAPSARRGKEGGRERAAGLGRGRAALPTQGAAGSARSWRPARPGGGRERSGAEPAGAGIGGGGGGMPGRLWRDGDRGGGGGRRGTAGWSGGERRGAIEGRSGSRGRVRGERGE